MYCLVVLLRETAFAQSPKVPITYPGDTERTIARRAKWIEGAKKEGGLVWWGVLNPNYKNAIIKEFYKVYPFIRVDHWRGQGAAVATKLEGENAAGHITVDLCLGGEPYNYPRWRKMGLIAKFTDFIPGIEQTDPKTYSRYGDWAQPGQNGVVPQYNTNLVSAAEAPKSWNDLLDPKWKGKMGIPKSSIKHWAGLALAEGGWGMEKTEKFLRILKEQNLMWGQGYSATHALMIAGEFRVQAQGYIYHVLQSRKKGAPVAWSKVDPILITGPSFILVPKGPHPNAARLFLEWLFSPQTLVKYEDITYYGSASPGAGTHLSKALEGLNLIYRVEETEIKMAELGLDKKFAAILGVTPGEGE